MNLDDMMDVWRSQDASPLHGVNEALLRLELRQEDAKTQRLLRWSRWFIYVLTAFMVADMGRYLALMLDRPDGALSGWDYAIPIVGAIAAVGFAVLVRRRYLSRIARERHFGESLRDQVNRQLVQLDYTGVVHANLAKLITFLLPSIVVAFAIILSSWRIHGRSFRDVGLSLPIGFMIVWSILCVGGTFLWTRRVVRRRTLPRKRRLEELLRELDG